MSHILKIVGESEMEQPLELDKDYLISINAGITKISKLADEQGGFIFSYQAKQRTCEILKDNGEIIKTKDKRSQSKKLRGQMINIALEAQIEPEEFYESTMIDLRHFLTEIIPFMAELKKKGL